MINRIKFKFGSSIDQKSLTFNPTSITVFVGPNNSGKSKSIAEIAEKCKNMKAGLNFSIIDEINFRGLDKNYAAEFIKSIQIKKPSAAPFPNNFFTAINGQNGIQYNIDNVLDALTNPDTSKNREFFSQLYLGPRTMILNGSNRIKLVDEQNGGDMQRPADSSFQQLFRNDSLRKRFSDLIFKGLGNYALIDPTNLGKLRLRLSSVAPPSPEVERGLGNTSVVFHAAAQPISAASDGAKAYAGILSEILAGDPKILLMDEPEAFLHPALAFRLGHEIAQSLSGTDKKIFVSTHSSQFLMGCIQSGVPINVIRLTYRNSVATARLLPNEKIVQLMRNPLLRSTGVISALFYESVVVTEADPDRAFYQEINERLLQKERGIPNCIFLNAQNKQTIPVITLPLRDLGIPTASIYDIDFIKCQGIEATRLMQAAGIPPMVQEGLAATRTALNKVLPAANSNYKRAGGINVISGADLDAANDYFDQLDGYGAFVVRNGELESWLPELGVGGHGPKWLVPIFEKMGEDPASPEYTQPSDCDVWSFVDKIAEWLTNPSRKGLPT